MKFKKVSSILLLAGTVLLAGCGSSADTKNEETSAPATEAAASETTYPITIEHALGTTTIESEPKNVVTISWGNQDVPLALGVVPVGVSKANFGQIEENGLLKWTSDAFKELGEEKPVVFDDTDGLDYEAISNAEPDVILAGYSGLTQEEYDLLSEIAPAVAYQTQAWQTYWRDQILLNSKGMGKEAEGEALVKELETFITEKSSQYSDIKGKKAAFLYFNPSDLGTFYVYLPTDPRAAYLEDLGMVFPESIKKLAEGESTFSVALSSENVDLLKDLDIIVTYGDDTVLKTLQEDKLIGSVPAIANGAVVMMDNNSAIAAACTPSALSIPATLEEYLGMIQKAADKVK